MTVDEPSLPEKGMIAAESPEKGKKRRRSRRGASRRDYRHRRTPTRACLHTVFGLGFTLI
jgi:hypothetical protein